MRKQALILLVKYGLGLGLLVWVVCWYWHISSGGQSAAVVSASTLGLMATPLGQGPVVAASGLYNGRVDQEVGLAGVFERPVHWEFLALAAAMAGGSVLLTFVRWYFLVRAQDLPFTLPSALRLGLIGFYLNTFLVGAVGGDIIKAAFIAREQSRRTIAVITVIMDRVIGLCGLVWLVGLVGFFSWASGVLPQFAASPTAVAVLESIFLLALGLMASSVLFWLVLGLLPRQKAERFKRRLRRIPKIGGPLSEMWQAGWLYRCRPGSVGLALGLAIVGHLGFVLFYYCAARTLSSAADIPSLPAHFVAVPVGMIISAGIPTPGGVGGGELVFGKVYELLGFTFAAGVLGLLMKRCIECAIGLVGYLVYLRLRPGLTSAAERPAEVEFEPVPAEAHSARLSPGDLATSKKKEKAGTAQNLG